MLFATFTGFVAGGLTGAVIATFSVFLPSFVFVLWGARYVELLRNNSKIQAFLAGVSAAVVGVILVVSLELIPPAIVGFWSIALAIAAFVAIAAFKVDVAVVAVAAMSAGIIYSLIRLMLF